MELIYSYIKKFRKFEEQEINYGGKFTIKLNKDRKSLSITHNKHLSNFYGEHISNISTIVGRNGTGKTNLCDMLGCSDRVLGFEEHHLEYAQSDDNQSTQFLNIFYSETMNENYRLANKFQEAIFYIEASSAKLLSEFIDTESKKNSKSENAFFFTLSKNDKLIYLLSTDKLPVCLSNNTIHKMSPEDFGGDIFIKNTKVVLYRMNYSPVNFSNYFDSETERYRIDRINLRRQDTKISERIRYLYNCVKTPNERLFDNLDGYLFKLEYKNIDYLRASIFWGEDTDDFILRFKRAIIFWLAEDKSKEIIDENFRQSYLHNILDVYKNNNISTLEKQENLVELLGAEREERFRGVVDFLDRNKNYFNIEEKLFQFRISEDTLLQNLEIYCDFLDLIVGPNYYGMPFQRKQFFENIFAYEINILTEGQRAALEMFSALDSIIVNRDKKLKHKDVTKFDNYIIILDEPETSLHPEYCRNLVSNLIYFCDNAFSFLSREIIKSEQPSKAKFSFIISTHSPFILSDIPSENIVKLNVDEDDKNAVLPQTAKTFGMNIQTLLSDAFFMDSTIGEFAKEKIKKIIEKIKPNNGKYNTISEETAKLIRSEISIIGDDLLRQKLDDMLDMCLYNGDLKDKYIQRLDAKIKRLKKLKDQENDSD